ncbi:MAG: hypothetical protein IKJ87_03390 [Ruminococcus sp.]|nr:hypothetical protein [Ruminococcus sp.]
MLIEFIMSLILEGTLEAGTSRKVPLLLRIFLLLVFFSFYAAIIGVFIMLGVNSLKNGRIFGASAMFVIAAIIALMVIVWFIRTCKSKHIR